VTSPTVVSSTRIFRLKTVDIADKIFDLPELLRPWKIHTGSIPEIVTSLRLLYPEMVKDDMYILGSSPHLLRNP
jgi:hypothetical protein